MNVHKLNFKKPLGIEQGDQMSLQKIRPKCSPTHFWVKLILLLSSTKILARYFCILKRLTKANNLPTGESSPNLGPML
jgi:hypothetical protein